jgi:beta-mannosidase
MMGTEPWYVVGQKHRTDYDTAVAAAFSQGRNCSVPTTLAQIYPTADEALDYWFVRHLTAHGRMSFVFEGISAPAEIWINGKLLATVNTMHAEYEVATVCNGINTIAVCCTTTTNVTLPRVRQRWRQQLISDQKLRQIRNTSLGRMPGWSPRALLVGPYRPVRIEKLGLVEPFISVTKFKPVFYHDVVLCHIEFIATNLKAYPTFFMDDISYQVSEQDKISSETNQFKIAIPIPDAELWFPHTHGLPYRYRLWAVTSGREFNFGFVGLRDVTRGADFSITVNGVDVFCRGAVWTEASMPKLASTASDYRPVLELCRDAGFNMLRVPGTTLYQTKAFYDLCDELGLMVWQDFMFANFDYPQTEDFEKLITFETINFLNRTNYNACIVVLCGGSEVYQQAAMLGLRKDQYQHSLFSEVLPSIVVEHTHYPTIYVENSPDGGDWPFQTNVGATHYFGVPAYLRELSDIRRSDVKFASECMAIANVPCPDTVRMVGAPAVHHPKWKESVPRDNNVSWDFEDVRDHYLAKFFAVDPNTLRRIDQDRYLELSRAVPCIIVNEIFSEWRSSTSRCSGGLILNLQDLAPGCGWGLIDSNGSPKSTFFALKQISQPVQVVITDEGLNGLDIHVINETESEISGALALNAYNDGVETISGEIGFVAPPRSGTAYSSRLIVPHFFDAAYSYKFGAPSHNVNHACIIINDNIAANAFHFPIGHNLRQDDIGLNATLQNVDGRWMLSISSVKFAQFVHIDIPGFVANIDWQHIAPNRSYVTELLATGTAPVKPNGYVLALNSHKRVKV